jgi:hypothetical protein
MFFIPHTSMLKFKNLLGQNLQIWNYGPLALWPFGLSHAVYIWNHISCKDSRLLLFELLTESVIPSSTFLQQQRQWQCAVYVLDPRLRNNQKLPKWNPRTCVGRFLGFSCQHSSAVGLILNRCSGSVSLQFHCVYNKLSTMVLNGLQSSLIPQNIFKPNLRFKSFNARGLEQVELDSDLNSDLL